jgi:integrase
LNSPDEKEQWGSLFLRESEVLELLDYVQKNAAHDFILPMFAFAALTGARRSEVIRSQIQDFHLDAGYVMIREKKRRHDVAVSYRRVDLHGQLRETMSNWFTKHPGGPHTICMPANLIRSRTKTTQPEPLTENRATDHFRRTLRGSKWENVRGFHVLRHSFASICAMKGIHPSIIDQWLGHQTEEMRNRYRHLFPEETKRAMDSIMVSEIGSLFGR